MVTPRRQPLLALAETAADHTKALMRPVAVALLLLGGGGLDEAHALNLTVLAGFPLLRGVMLLRQTAAAGEGACSPCRGGGGGEPEKLCYGEGVER